MRRAFAPGAWFFVAILTTLLAVGRSAMIRDPGLLWHTVAGERMVGSGEVLRVDPFGVREGRPWIAMEWLAECLMALVHRAAGIGGLLLGGSVVLAAIFTFLANRLLAVGCRPIATTLVLALAAASSANHLIVRPHLASMALYACLIALVLDVDGGRVGPKRLVFFVPTFTVWANLHGGVVAGLATLSAVVLGWLVFRVTGRPSPATSRARMGLFIGVVFLAAAAMLVSPFGFQLPLAWVRIICSRDLSSLLAEHEPLFTSPGAALGVSVLGAGYLVLLAGVPRASVRASWLLPGLCFCAAWTKILYAPYFAISATLVVAELLPRCDWLRRRTLGTGSLLELGPPRSSARPIELVTQGTVVAIAAALQLSGLRVPVFGAGWARLDPGNAPLDVKGALDAASARLPDGSGILNDLDFGGFCIYFEPRLRVFIDDRFELYGAATLVDYIDASTHRPAAAEAYADRFHLRLALVRSDSAFDVGLRASPHWVSLAQGRTANVYERR